MSHVKNIKTVDIPSGGRSEVHTEDFFESEDVSEDVSENVLDFIY